MSTYGTNTLRMIDASNTVIANIGVSNLPLGVDVMAGSDDEYTGNLTGNSVSVVNTATNTLVATIPTGASIWRSSGTGGRVCVASTGSGNTVINTVTNTVFATVAGVFGADSLGCPMALALMWRTSPAFTSSAPLLPIRC